MVLRHMADPADHYPTRLGEPGRRVRRRDPTVWGTIEFPELAGFDADGFAAVEDLLTPAEVAEFSAEIRRDSAVRASTGISDFETWHAEDGMPVPRAVSLSIALTDNYPVAPFSAPAPRPT